MKKPTPAARSKARRFVLQGLYQMRLTGHSVDEVMNQLVADHDMKRVDTTYFREVIQGVDIERVGLLEALAKHLDRKVSELDPIETAALSIGAYELMHRIDIPYRVAINEAVELAKQFGATESHKLVNNVLDALAKEYRVAEYARKK